MVLKTLNHILKKMIFLKLYIDYPREELIQKNMHDRTEQMIEMGAMSMKLKGLLKLKVRKDKSVNKAIGISEIKEYWNKRKDI